MLRRLPLPLFLLAACQPLPHPFADDRPPPNSPLLAPRDSAGVLVRAIPEEAPLAEAMAAALRDREIPASTQGRNKGSYELLAFGEPPAGSGSSVPVVDWELRSPDGRSLGHVSASGDAASVVAAAAPGIARLLQDDPPWMAAGADPILALRPVTGAPGDGGRALLRAMAEALRRAHVALAERQDAGSLILTGAVALSAPEAGTQQVKVHWALLAADGRELGRIDQENVVPAGSLDGAWGDVAYAVASAAAPGVAALIERVKAEAVRS